jgi:hypothetical protein
VNQTPFVFSGLQNFIISSFENNGLVAFMVFKSTFNNISVMLWRSVLFVDETGVPEEKYQSAASH